ncbi:hypothetical protein M2422_004417 [Enterobacter sp. SLBN-59]|nr:hypothetical protein [Enterobacter sp. SLBN-59]
MSSHMHPHVHVSVTCGGIDAHGKWKKISFRKDAMCARWMWNIRQLLLSVWFKDVALPPSLSHITTESQWRSLILTAGGDYWHVYMSKKTAGGSVRDAHADSRYWRTFTSSPRLPVITANAGGNSRSFPDNY